MPGASAAAIVVCVLLLALPTPARAHDVPYETTVVAFIKPEGQHLRVVVRLPVEALTPRGILFGGIVIPTQADGRVDLGRADKTLSEAARTVSALLPIYEGGEIVALEAVGAVRLSPPDDRSFVSYESAVAHVVDAAAADDSGLETDQGFFDAVLDYRIASDRSEFVIQPQVTALAERVHVALRFLPPGGGVRAYDIDGGTGAFRLDPRWYQAALGFVWSGFTHILEGTDHLLFLVCLVIPLRRIRALIPVVTAFTVAHSVTLVASAYGVAPSGDWFAPMVESIIAASIVYMALENIVVEHPRRRWMSTFLFGLVHGFGFSFILSDTLQFSGNHLLEALVAFNVGVELGQLFVLALAVPALALLFRCGVSERAGSIALSLVIAHVGWHWMIDRGHGALQGASVEGTDSAWVSWLLALALVSSVTWLVYARSRRRLRLWAQNEPSNTLSSGAAA